MRAITMGLVLTMASFSVSMAGQQTAPAQAAPAPGAPAQPVPPAEQTVKLEVRVFDGSDDVTHESKVKLYPKGQRSADIPMTAAGAGQAVSVMVPVGFYDAQAIRERRGEAPSIRWAQQWLVQRYPDEYGRHLRARNFRGVHEANDAFHLAMFAACGNPYLVESIKHYMWLSLPVRSKKTADYDHAAASERDHHLIIQLLMGTDGWARAQVCVDHLQSAKNAYLQRAVEA